MYSVLNIGEFIIEVNNQEIHINSSAADMLDFDLYANKNKPITLEQFCSATGIDSKEIFKASEAFNNKQNNSDSKNDRGRIIQVIKPARCKKDDEVSLIIFAKVIITIKGNVYIKGSILNNPPAILSLNLDNEIIKAIGRELFIINADGLIIDAHADFKDFQSQANCEKAFSKKSCDRINYYLGILNGTYLDEVKIPVNSLADVNSKSLNLWIKKMSQKANDPIYFCSVSDLEFLKSYYQRLDQLYLAFENTQEGVGILNAENQYIYLNKAHVSIFGYEDEKELLGKSWEIFYDEKEQERIKENMLPELIKSGFNQGFTRGLKKDGGSVLQYITLRKTEGFLICITSDVTQHYVKQDLINEFNLMLSTMSDFALITNQEGKIEWCNNSFRNLVNIEEKEHVNLNDLFSFNQYLTDMNIWFEQNEQNKDFKVIIMDRFGISRTFRIKIHKILNQLMGSCHFAITGSDISEIIEKEKQLSKEIENQRELNFLKTNFINFSSHELRSPLTGILNNIDLISIKANSLSVIPKEDKEKINKYVLNATEEIRKIENTINNVLLLGRIDSANIKISPVKFSILELLYAVIKDETRKYDGKRSVRIKIVGEEKDVLIDVSLFVYVIKNMISNALKYSEEQPDPIFTVDFGNDIILSVEDFGIGINEQDLSQIFKPYFRADNAKVQKGSGLGLAIVKHIVDLHQGEINVTSILNKGTKVTVKLSNLRSNKRLC
jgi:PAS domain S-box-containing protein